MIFFAAGDPEGNCHETCQQLGDGNRKPDAVRAEPQRKRYNGFDAGKYVSFEEQINNYKAYYYEALRQSSVGWEAGENSYFPFVENFLSTLYMCYKELDKRFAVVHGKKVTKKARVEATVLNNLTPISKAEICKILPDVSPTTVEAVLGAMVKTGSIKRIGAGRAARYIKA